MVAALQRTAESFRIEPGARGHSGTAPQLRLVRGGTARRSPVSGIAGRRPSAAVYRRRRRAVAALALVVGFGAWLGARAVLTAAPSPLADSGGIATRVYYVHPGDTLWSIAAQLHPGGDERSLVDALSAEVHGQPLQVGEALRVP